MKERPIIFSGPMINAILAGRKTQTRRIIYPLVDRDRPDAEKWPAHSPFIGEDGVWRFKNGVVSYADNDRRCKYGRPGDRLWVRETWLMRGAGQIVVYRADAPSDAEAAGFGAMYGGWRPSIYMPRDRSRITLEITNVRVQRLQEISNPDAIAEGVEYGTTTADFAPHAVYAFERLWDSINAKRAPWSSNPWVWAITFKRLGAT